MSLRILIADDEPLARARLRALVEELGHEVCSEAADGASAAQEMLRTQPDVLLLDIEMPGIDGLTLADRIASAYPDIAVVLVTAHPEHALDAFEIAVADYLVKPVHIERLAKTLVRVEEQKTIGFASPMVRITVGRKERIVPLHEIDCFQSEQGCVVAKTPTICGFVDATLSDLEDQLGPHLLRVHRSCLAVRSAISGIDTVDAAQHELRFRSGKNATAISRRCLQDVRTFLRITSRVNKK
jgi:two-component system, LytTR family, response regulator AlgR